MGKTNKPIRQIFEVELNFNNSDTNALNDGEEITKKSFEAIIHDFELSENNTRIEKETAEKALDSLKNLPVVCQYFESTDPENPNDALGDHGVVLKIDRDGDLSIHTNTIAIGVFTEPAFIDTITDKEGNEKEVVKGRGVLWRSRYYDIIQLLEDWWEAGIPIKSSMEILYNEYHVKDGITTVDNYIFEGHALLQSVDTDEHEKVEPAYKDSEITKFQRLVAQAVKKGCARKQELAKKEEDKVSNKIFKKVYELSHSDIRSKLYQEIDSNLTESQYSYINPVYDDYFIVNIYSYEDSYDKYFKYTYEKNDETDEVVVDFDSKIEVTPVLNWVEVEIQELQIQLNDANKEIEGLKSQIDEIPSEEEILKPVKAEFNKQLADKDKKIEELQEYKNTVEKAKFDAEMADKLEEQKGFYSAKFKALNASEKFNSDEVQNLISKSISNDPESEKAKLQLNSMLVDLVEIEEEKKQEPIRELSSTLEDLVPEDDDFDSRYGI